MNQLIEDLLAYSRVERRELTLRRVELQPFIDGLAGEKRNDLDERGVQLALHVNGESVWADASGLAQAVRNYLDNAIKFTRDVPEPRIEIGAEEYESNSRLWVSDNGIGFDMKYHDEIFKIFNRLHRAEEYSGTGVGLAIVRKAVERMGGRVWAESHPHQGATFFLEIPRRASGSPVIWRSE
jgi:signal transduction histidine kinase